MKKYIAVFLMLLFSTICLAGVAAANPLRDAQISLSRMGYHPGPADGVMGHKTREALKQFQRDNHLPITGQTDPQTMDLLRRHVPQETHGKKMASKHDVSPQRPHQKPSPEPQGLSVMAMQLILSSLGYHPGPADGQMGGRTQHALQQFQRDNRLPVTGQLDARTREQLQHKDPHR